MEYEEFDNNKSLSLTRFEKMLKTNRILFFDSNEFENIISYYLENGKINFAKKAIKLGLEQHPDSSNLALFEIEILIFENKLDNAEKLLEALILSEPSNEEVYIQKANIYSKKKLHQKAILCLNKILDFNPDNAEVYSLIGIEYLFMEDFENAKFNFIKCLNYDDSDYSALYNIVYCFEILEQNNKAIEYLNTYLNTNPYCEVAWHQLGKQYLFFKNYAKAISAFDFAIISDEYFIGAYIEKGRALEKINKYNEAIENYKLIIALKDESSYPLLRMGICYNKISNYKKAIQNLNDCIQVDPQLNKAWYLLAEIYYKNQKYNSAILSIKKALEINSEKEDYWKLYAKINIGLKLYEEADIGFQKVIELGEADESIWLAKVDTLIKLGEYNYAIDILEKCYELFEDKSIILYRFSGIYFLQNKIEDGIVQLKKAISINKKNKYIFKELFRVISKYKYLEKILK
ncbi:MAG: tetratricopeptide repeat protein [Flavobacteriales bacterium]|jgi:tetratricopeptide (TPR) repeat protein|nr:tetratricopeptide repeat protein [Flavobacteriaceae bacterium]RZP00259.1 MAG: tetratricopeptide repeat protein [Flavobacteriales bacterium]